MKVGCKPEWCLFTKTYKVIKTIKVGKSPFDVAFDPKTNRVYLVNTAENTITVIIGSTNWVITTIRLDQGR